MTNYEKYKEQIDWQARAGASLAVKKSDNTPTICEEFMCSECLFGNIGSCRREAVEWLIKAEDIEPKGEIEIGDKVEVTGRSYCYTTYADWVMGHVSDVGDKLSYDYGNLPSNGDIGIVKEKGLHPNGSMIYYIQLDTGRCYLIEEKGIKPSKKKEE